MLCNIEINNAPEVDSAYPYWVVNNVGIDGIWYFGCWKTKAEADKVVKECADAYGDLSKFVVKVA